MFRSGSSEPLVMDTCPESNPYTKLVKVAHTVVRARPQEGESAMFDSAIGESAIIVSAISDRAVISTDVT